MKHFVYFYYSYFLFIRKIYIKRWNGASSSANALGLACVLFIGLFLYASVDYYKDSKSIINNDAGLPLGPMVALLYLLGYVIILTIVRYSRISLNIGDIKHLIVNMKDISIVFPLLYVFASFILLFASIFFLLSES